MSVPVPSPAGLQSVISQRDTLCVSQSRRLSPEQWNNRSSPVQQSHVGTADRRRILIYHERCHYHANDFLRVIIDVSNISSGLAARRGFVNGTLLSVYENETLTARESADRKRKKKKSHADKRSSCCFFFLLLIEMSRHIQLNLGEIRK